MTTVNLEVLNNYEMGESEFIDFRNALGRWACGFIPEITTRIALHARDLFENRAIYGLVMHWDNISTIGKDMRLRDFAHIADIDNDLELMQVNTWGCARNTWEREAGEISQALYYLIIQKWD